MKTVRTASRDSIGGDFGAELKRELASMKSSPAHKACVPSVERDPTLRSLS